MLTRTHRAILEALLDGRDEMIEQLRREMHELRAEKRAAIDNADDALTKEQARSEHMLDAVLSLKASGATSILRAAAASGTAKPVAKERSAISQAIDEHPRANSSIAYRNYLSGWAAKELVKIPEGVDEDAWVRDICDRIRSAATVSHADEDEGDSL